MFVLIAAALSILILPYGVSSSSSLEFVKNSKDMLEFLKNRGKMQTSLHPRKREGFIDFIGPEKDHDRKDHDLYIRILA